MTVSRPGRVGGVAVTIARGLGAFFAAYAGLSLIALILGRPHNQNAWWIDLSMLPTPLNLLLQLALVAVLVAFAVRVPHRRLTRRLGAGLCALFCVFALLNIIAVYDAQASGLVRLGFPLPFSFFIALVFLWLTLALLLGYRCKAPERNGASSEKGSAFSEQDSASSKRNGASPKRDSTLTERGGIFSEQDVTSTRRSGEPLKKGGTPPEKNGSPRRRLARVRTAVGIIATVVVVGILFPLGQILCFGTTSYRQSVDAVVVLGARAYPDGTPSLALKDRLDAAISVYEQGYAPVLIMSGGIDADGVNEARVMKDYAVSRGVPESAVLLDERGNSTRETAENTIEIARAQGYEQLGVVSTFYHMARIKMLYLVNGCDVLTMPAPIDERDSSIPITTLREIPGWWYYWFANILT